NSNHIEPRRFLEDASEIVLERVQCIMQRYDSIKKNTIFNGEFVTSDKRANKSISTRNYELYQYTDLREWYVTRVVEPILTSLEEFQERDSGWALSRILNLAVNANKHTPLCAGCHIKLPREIILKRAVINVQSAGDACFAWSVIAALHPAPKHVERVSSYPHYSTVLNLAGIEFPMTLSQIRYFENSNDISINVYAIVKGIMPIRLADRKKSRHVNLLYVENDSAGHFVLIKDLFRLVSSQINKKEHKKYFCDRCFHYFNSTAKQEMHSEDCEKINNGANKAAERLSFRNHCRKERVPFVVYADLECALEKTDSDSQYATHTYQHHNVFSVGYYVQCSYDSSLSGYRFRRDKDCIAWFTISIIHNLSGYDAHFIIKIELNTKFRTLAKNDFEKNLYKLLNNAVFGKTMENVRERVDVKLLTKWEGRYGAEAMIAKQNFHSRSVFLENLVAIELRKLEVKFDKPIYVGMCILDISKTCLYEFHHEYMAPVFREKCKIMYTDTDSLIWYIM
ncbi:hypothetical protein ALC57_13214, partial [Trachymyrmex cornetzi]